MTIQEFMESNNFSQSSLARQLNVSSNLVSLYANNKVNISYRVWKKFRDIFGIEITK